MRELCSGVGTNANAAAEESLRNTTEKSGVKKNGTIIPDHNWFGLMARKLWKFTAAKDLFFLLGGERTDRTCRAWASADSEPAASILVALLRTADGAAILDHVMADCQVAWWQARLRDRAIAEMYDRHRAEAKRLGVD